MITLYNFYPSWGFSCFSQFVLKVETYLRMTDLPFRTESLGLRWQETAPKGKLPYIEHNGKLIADSGFILDYLKSEFGDPLDAWLTPAQRALGHATRRLVEEHLRWVMAHDRWTSPEEPYFHTSGFQALPRGAYDATRDLYLKQLRDQGIGAHSPSEIEQLGREDIEALAGILGEQPYFLGQQPSSLDATTYGFLAHVLYSPHASALKSAAQSHLDLVRYCDRMRERFFCDEASVMQEAVAK